MQQMEPAPPSYTTNICTTFNQFKALSLCHWVVPIVINFSIQVLVVFSVIFFFTSFGLWACITFLLHAFAP